MALRLGRAILPAELVSVELWLLVTELKCYVSGELGALFITTISHIAQVSRLGCAILSTIIECAKSWLLMTKLFWMVSARARLKICDLTYVAQCRSLQIVLGIHDFTVGSIRVG